MKKSILLLLPFAVFAISCASHHSHSAHSHQHGVSCGHLTVQHDGHSDYLDEGHLHHVHDAHVDEHIISVSATNPNQCTPGFAAEEHAAKHVHGAKCGHAVVPHGSHLDYLVNGVLHHLDGNHCDNHGSLVAK